MLVSTDGTAIFKKMEIIVPVVGGSAFGWKMLSEAGSYFKRGAEASPFSFYYSFSVMDFKYYKV